MALRKACAESKAAAPTHALVQFERDNTIDVAPLKRISSPSREELGKGAQCVVEWARGKFYNGVVLAIGKASCVCSIARVQYVCVHV